MTNVNDKLSEYLEFLKTPEGEESILKLQKKWQLEDNQKDINIERIKKMFSNQETFDYLVNRIISKLFEWKDKCNKKCYEYEPYGNQILYSLFDLAEKEGELTDPIDDFTNHFSSDIYTYNGWQFALTYGQGTCSSIYYNKKLMYRG